MSEENIVRARREPDGQLVQVLPDGSTRPLERMTEADWTRFDAMTEEEVYQNALDDPDNPPRTAAELERMPRIPNPRTLRLSMNLTQEEFARKFHISVGTIRDWELGIRWPDGTAKTYLRVIEKIPDAVAAALNPESAEHAAETSTARQTKTA